MVELHFLDPLSLSRIASIDLDNKLQVGNGMSYFYDRIFNGWCKTSKISVSFGYIQDSDRPLWADTPLPSSHPTDKENVMRVRNKLVF